MLLVSCLYSGNLGLLNQDALFPELMIFAPRGKYKLWWLSQSQPVAPKTLDICSKSKKGWIHKHTSLPEI